MLHQLNGAANVCIDHIQKENRPALGAECLHAGPPNDPQPQIRIRSIKETESRRQLLASTFLSIDTSVTFYTPSIIIVQNLINLLSSNLETLFPTSDWGRVTTSSIMLVNETNCNLLTCGLHGSLALENNACICICDSGWEDPSNQEQNNRSPCNTLVTDLPTPSPFSTYSTTSLTINTQSTDHYRAYR